MSGPPVVALVLVAAGLLLVAVGAARGAAQRSRHRSWRRVRGRVVGERRGVGDATSRGWLPVVEFPADGGTVRGTPRWSTWNGISRIGRDIDVWYDPESPSRFDAASRLSDRAGFLWVVVGVPVLAAGLLGTL